MNKDFTIIGIALLAFVLQDLFQSQGRNREYNIAVVDGEKIPYQDFEAQREKNLDNRRSNSNKEPFMPAEETPPNAEELADDGTVVEKDVIPSP